MKAPEIILENQDFMIVKKPAGMASETARVAEKDLVSWLRTYRMRHSMSEDARKDKAPSEIHLIERLDQPVEGLLIAAKNRKAAAELSGIQRAHEIQKTYLAVVSGPSPKLSGKADVHLGERRDASAASVNSDIGEGRDTAAVSADFRRLTDYIRRNSRTHMAEITDAKDTTGKKAELLYRILAVRREGKGAGGTGSEEAAVSTLSDHCRMLLELRLITGRYHQIRIQLSSRGYPIVGDRRYGGIPARQLELASVRVTFPWRGEKISAGYVPEFLTTEGFPSKMA